MTPGWFLVGEQHAAVEQQDLPVDLEGGHVAAHVPETTQGDDPERVGASFGGVLRDSPRGPP